MDDTDPRRLKQLATSAYAAELNSQVDEAIRLHEETVSALSKLVKQLSSLSTDEREQKRVVNKRIDLHRERIGILQLLKNGHLAATAYLVPPSEATASQQLSVTPPTLSIDELLRQRSVPQLQSAVPDFTGSLDPQLPTETYYIYSTNSFKQGFQRWFIYTIRDASDKHSLYILEACYRHNQQIAATQFYRAADYPLPCLRVAAGGVSAKQAPWEVGAGFKGRTLTLSPFVFPQAIVELPDRLGKQPWGPRRFSYGGRKFVWKVGDKSEDMRPESLYEYRSTSPKPGSRTGKMDDDALPTRLFWSDKMPFAQSKAKWTVHCVGGLDQLFKEYIFASQVTKLVVMYTDVT